MKNQTTFVPEVLVLGLHKGLKFMVFNSAGKLYLLNHGVSKVIKNEKWQFQQMNNAPSWCFN